MYCTDLCSREAKPTNAWQDTGEPAHQVKLQQTTCISGRSRAEERTSLIQHLRCSLQFATQQRDRWAAQVRRSWVRCLKELELMTVEMGNPNGKCNKHASKIVEEKQNKTMACWDYWSDFGWSWKRRREVKNAIPVEQPGEQNLVESLMKEKQILLCDSLLPTS